MWRRARRWGTTRRLPRRGRCGVALLPVGYADGLRRELSVDECEAGWMGDGRGAGGAAIVGRVSMNLTVVDVTGIEGVRGWG